MSIYNFSVKDINQKDVSLKQYEGKVLLIVNTAPKCGFAPQYEGLEKMYEDYKEKGFEILDFPSNQFLSQAPGTDQEIKAFCELNYQTQFQTFSKINVNGKHAIELYQYLKEKGPSEIRSNGKQEGFITKLFFGKKIKWNFTKFLIDQKGNILYRFSPQVKPKDIRPYVEKLLTQ